MAHYVHPLEHPSNRGQIFYAPTLPGCAVKIRVAEPLNHKAPKSDVVGSVGLAEATTTSEFLLWLKIGERGRDLDFNRILILIAEII